MANSISKDDPRMLPPGILKPEWVSERVKPLTIASWKSLRTLAIKSPMVQAVSMSEGLPDVAQEKLWGAALEEAAKMKNFASPQINRWILSDEGVAAWLFVTLTQAGAKCTLAQVESQLDLSNLNEIIAMLAAANQLHVATEEESEKN